jgi:D-3-phosphoglycerate dehydrogenase
MITTSRGSRKEPPILLSAIDKESFEPALSAWVKSNFEIKFLGLPLDESDKLRVEVFCSSVFPIVNEAFCVDYPNLKFVLSPTTGLTHIDTNFLGENLVQLISLKGRQDFLKEITSTSEFAWGLMLSVWRKIPSAARLESFNTEKRADFVSRQLKGREIGLIGFGRIGRKVAEYALTFGMRVHFFDPYCILDKDEVGHELVSHDSIESILSSSDVVMISASVIDQDREKYPLINRQNIKLMRMGAVLINISRGIFVDELAIEESLTEGRLFGVGLDVLSSEEFSSKRHSHNLYKLRNLGYNVVITPHIGGMSSDALTLCIAEVLNDLQKGLINQ